MIKVGVVSNGRGEAVESQPLPSLRIKKKEKVFTAGVTREAKLYLGLMALPFLAMSWSGIGMMVKTPMLGIGVLGAGLLLMFAAGGWLSTRMGKTIRVTPERFVYEHRNVRIAMPWADMKKFYPPSDLQRYFRVARISDGQQEIFFDSLTFAEFDMLVSLIAVARKNKVAVKDNTYEV